jgi:peroxiredoxin
MLVAGDSGPEFVLPDVSGQPRSVSEALAGGPVVLAFLKADCATCQLTFPYLERLRQAYPGNTWQIWGICQHPARAAAWFAKTTGVTFPLLIDGEGFPVSCAYDPAATPTVYLLDGKGTVRATYVGFAKRDLNLLAGQVAELLGAEAVIIAPPDDGKPSFRPG